MDFESSFELKDYYVSLIQSIEQIKYQFCTNDFVHYPTIQENLIQCLRLIDVLITWETDHCSFLAICQQKEELTLSLQLIQKLMEKNTKNEEKNTPKDNYNQYTTEKPEKIIETTAVIPKLSGLSEIIGLSDIKKTLRSAVLLPRTQPQLFCHFQMCNRILLYGPPGTGKTHLVHALAAEAEATFHSVSAGDVLSHYVGQTERTIKALFDHLKRNADCTILFIDEIDALCRKRSDNEQEHTRRVKTEFMCQMTSIENCCNFLICATNCPWDLDPAILRRFQKRIFVPLPDKLERLEFLEKLLANPQFNNNVPDWNLLVQKTNGYSGSDLYNVIQSAMSIPLNELEDTKIWASYKGVYKPVVSEQDYSNVICCDFRDLPWNTVRARKTCYSDLLTALESIKSTVVQSDLKKFEQFRVGLN